MADVVHRFNNVYIQNHSPQPDQGEAAAQRLMCEKRSDRDEKQRQRAAALDAFPP